MTDFNTLLAAANQAFSALHPQERERLKRERACKFVFSGLLLTAWAGQYRDIEMAYDNRLETLQ